MARHGKSLIQVSIDLGLGLTVKEAERIQVEPEFVATLRGEKFKYYAEIQRDPNNTKAALIGRLHHIADELVAKKSFKDAGAQLVAAAKIEGWLNDQTSVTVFGDVSAKDITALKEKLAKEVEKVKIQ